MRLISEVEVEFAASGIHMTWPDWDIPYLTSTRSFKFFSF